MSAASIAAEVEGMGVSLSVLRPYTAHCIKLVCLAVAPEGRDDALWRLGRRAVFQHGNDPKHTSKTTTALLKKLRVKVICGASSNGGWRSAKSPTSTSSVMS